MVQVLLFLFILLLSFPADAAFTIHLRNGSTISGVSSYEKKRWRGHCLFRWWIHGDTRKGHSED